MRTPRNGEYRASTGHLLQLGKASNGETRFHLIELLAKKALWKSPQTTQPVANTKDCSPKMYRGPYFWGQHPHNSLNMEKSNWCLHGALTPHSSLLVRECTLQATKRKLWTSTLPQSLLSTICPGYKIGWGNDATELVREAKHGLIWLKTTPQEGIDDQHYLDSQEPETR